MIKVDISNTEFLSHLFKKTIDIVATDKELERRINHHATQVYLSVIKGYARQTYGVKVEEESQHHHDGSKTAKYYLIFNDDKEYLWFKLKHL